MSTSDLRHTVLIIDDEPPIRRAVRNTLAALNARVFEAGTGRDGIALAEAVRPDLVVLDLGLPDMPGVDVCRAIRRAGPSPIIVLSSRHAEDEKVQLLQAGAEDYITKPFSLRELVARVQVQLRRRAFEATAGAPPSLTAGDLIIDFGARRAFRSGEPVALTATEWRLLEFLARNAGRTMTHREIAAAVPSRGEGTSQQHLRVHITHLRRKIEGDPGSPTVIITEPGVGYRFELPAEATRPS